MRFHKRQDGERATQRAINEGTTLPGPMETDEQRNERVAFQHLIAAMTWVGVDLARALYELRAAHYMGDPDCDAPTQRAAEETFLIGSPIR